MSNSDNYEIVIFYSAEEHAYVAEAPNLTGCVADGKTYAEALANVDVVINKWMKTAKSKGKPLPKHRRIMFA